MVSSGARGLLGALVVCLASTPLASRPQSRVADEGGLRIDAAIYGQTGGAADVTPLVRELVTPDRDELYVAPFFLRVDPSVGQPKDLVIFYRYQGQQHVLTIGEPSSVSYAVLFVWARAGNRDQFSPPASLRADAPLDDGLEIHEAYYGRGPDYRLVTPRVRALLDDRKGSFINNDDTLREDTGILPEFLVITYSHHGRRTTLRIQPDAKVSYAQLAANAAKDRPEDQRRPSVPAWLAQARPEPPRSPDDVSTGLGRAPFNEAAVAKLLLAAAELEAIAADDRSTNVVRALDFVRDAIRFAQLTIDYPFPRPGSSSVIPALGPAGTGGRLLNAAAALHTALRQFEMAGPQPESARPRFLAIAAIARAQALLPAVSTAR